MPVNIAEGSSINSADSNTDCFWKDFQIDTPNSVAHSIYVSSSSIRLTPKGNQERHKFTPTTLKG